MTLDSLQSWFWGWSKSLETSIFFSRPFQAKQQHQNHCYILSVCLTRSLVYSSSWLIIIIMLRDSWCLCIKSRSLVIITFPITIRLVSLSLCEVTRKQSFLVLQVDHREWQKCFLFISVVLQLNKKSWLHFVIIPLFWSSCEIYLICWLIFNCKRMEVFFVFTIKTSNNKFSHCNHDADKDREEGNIKISHWRCFESIVSVPAIVLNVWYVMCAFHSLFCAICREWVHWMAGCNEERYELTKSCQSTKKWEKKIRSNRIRVLWFSVNKLLLLAKRPVSFPVSSLLPSRKLLVEKSVWCFLRFSLPPIPPLGSVELASCLKDDVTWQQHSAVNRFILICHTWDNTQANV